MRKVTDIKEIHRIELNILKYIDKVCKENDIKYSLAGGTALGAVRHKGFIPWDDDIDLMMTKPNYDKFIEVMNKTNHPQYKALYKCDECPNYFYGFIKVVDLNTELQDSSFIRNKDLGVAVDIFPLTGAPHNINSLFKKYQRYKRLTFSSAAKKYKKSGKGFKRSVAKFILFCITRFTTWQFWYKKCEKIAKKCPYEISNRAGSLEGSYGLKEILDKSVYENYIEIDFEDSKFPIVRDYDTYLSSIYGDYMTPPPKNKQISNHNFNVYIKEEERN